MYKRLTGKIYCHNRFFVTLLLSFNFLTSFSYTIYGRLKNHANEEVFLKGYCYLESVNLGSTKIDGLGYFSLEYTNSHIGVGLLEIQGYKPLRLILEEPRIEIDGNNIQEISEDNFKKSSINKEFIKSARSEVLRNKAYSAWLYLNSIYSTPEFKFDDKVLKQISREILRLDLLGVKMEDKRYSGVFLDWFLSHQKLINDMKFSPQSRPDRIPDYIDDFKSIDFEHPYFKTSGLFGPIIESHFFMLENMCEGLNNDKMNESTCFLIESVKNSDTILNGVVSQLFKYFEKRSLFSALTYLAEFTLDGDYYSLLNYNNKCALEKYKSLKVGKKAPDIELRNGFKLSDANNNILLVFGASWCPYCLKDIKALMAYKASWKKYNNLEIVYISLDVDNEDYVKTFKGVPWLTYCDLSGWETKSAKDYFVNSTPSYYLLDKRLNILSHPQSLGQVDSWVKNILK